MESGTRTHRVHFTRLLRFAESQTETAFHRARWVKMRGGVQKGLLFLFVTQTLLMVINTVVVLLNGESFDSPEEVGSFVLWLGLVGMLWAIKRGAQWHLEVIYEAMTIALMPTLIQQHNNDTGNQTLAFVYWYTVTPLLIGQRFCHACFAMPFNVSFQLIYMALAPADTAIARSLETFGKGNYFIQPAGFTIVMLVAIYSWEKEQRLAYAQALVLHEENIRLEVDADPFSLHSLTSWFLEKREVNDSSLSVSLLSSTDSSSSSSASEGASFGPTRALEQWDIPYSELKLRRLAGSGGSGRVYEGTFSGNRCAIKELYQPIASALELDEFAVECATLYKLRHPNIVAFFGICAHELRAFLVTEFLPYELTDLVLNDDARLPPVHEMARQLAAGCKYMHAQGVVHYDIKPQNVLVSETFELKLCDFGLSRLESSGRESYLSTVAGTIQFMAPELLHSKPREGLTLPDASKVDVYAYGILLWSLLAKQLPYMDCCWADLADKALNEERPPVGEDWDEALVALMRACWRTNPTERPSFEEVVDTLDERRDER